MDACPTESSRPYRGRIAPSPTGLLHLGHARTFLLASIRADHAGGTCLLRMEDLDQARCKPPFVDAIYEDLRWLGLEWAEGPDIGGPHIPYSQSERGPTYLKAWKRLLASGQIYPSPHSRKDMAAALSAPHGNDGESIFPPELRPPLGHGMDQSAPGSINWRFRVPNGETLHFEDRHFGRQSFTAGHDFGDFLVWRRDGFPSYEMAVVTDDHLMGITEVVRGADLLMSTARQLLLYRALNWEPPDWFHCPLVCDATGKRLAKRFASLSLRALREEGISPAHLRASLLAIGQPSASSPSDDAPYPWENLILK